jgi:putative transcriptional regulator
VESLIGKFLLAGHKLLDPNFARTVVLIVRHDEQGAFGLVINRPMNLTIGKAIGPIIESASNVEEPVYFGGPCEGPVFVLPTDAGIGGDEPLSGVFTTTDRDAIETLLAGAAEPLKLFASYSGWGAAQLEGELAEGSWVVCDAKIDEVFSIDEHLWSRLHTRAHLSRYVDPDRIPDDPSVN